MLRPLIAPFLLLGVAGAAPAPSLDWIGGHWCAGMGEETVEEVWLPPHGIRFENRKHDFPQRIEYRREGDALRAETAGPGENGKEKVIAFDYRRCGS